MRAGIAFAALALASCASSPPVEGSDAGTAPPVTYPPPVRVVPVLTNPNRLSQPPQDFGGVVEVDRSFAKCRACHTSAPGRHGIGPSLAGAYGRPAASAPNYRYSTALKESGLVWDAATLDKFLENPRAMIPGAKMSFAGLKDPLQRAQVIAYIERFKD